MANYHKISGRLFRCVPEFCPQSQIIFCACSSVLKAFSIYTGENIFNLDGHEDDITSIKINPGNPLQLITSSLDGSLRIWDYKEQALCLKTFQIGCPLLSMDLAPSNTAPYHTRCFLVLGNPGKMLKKKKRKNKKKVRKEGGGQAAKTDENLTRFSLSAEKDFPFLMVEYDLGTQKIVSTLARSKKCPIGMASLSGLGTDSNRPQTVVMATPTILTVVNADTGKRIARRKAEDGKEFTALATSTKDNKPLIATGHRTGHIHLWHGLTDPQASGKSGLVVTKHWHAHAVRSLRFGGPDGTYLLSGGEEAVLVIWQLSTSKQDFLPRLGSPLSGISVSADQEYYAVTVTDNSVRLVRAVDLNIMWQLGGLCLTAGTADEVGMEDFSSALQLVSDPRTGHVALNGKAGFLQFYDPWNDQITRLLEVCRFNRVSRLEDEHTMQQPYVTQSAFSSQGGVLVTVDRRPGAIVTLQFWDLDSCAPGGFIVNTAVEHPHAKTVTSVACHPLGLAAVTTSEDGTFKLWHKKSRPGDALAFQERPTHWVSSFELKYRDTPAKTAAFSPDGSILAVGYEDLVTLWDPASSMLLGTLLPPTTSGAGLKGIGFAPEAPHLVGWTGTCFVVWDLLKLEVLWAYTAKTVSTVVVVGPEILGRTGAEGLEIPGRGVATMAACYKMKAAGQWCLLAFDTGSCVPLYHWRLPPGCQPCSLSFAIPSEMGRGDGNSTVEADSTDTGLLALTEGQEAFFLSVKTGQEIKGKKNQNQAVSVLGKGSEQKFPVLTKGKRKRQEDYEEYLGTADPEQQQANMPLIAKGLDGLLPLSSLDLPAVSMLFDSFMAGHLRQAPTEDPMEKSKSYSKAEGSTFTEKKDDQSRKNKPVHLSTSKPVIQEELLSLMINIL